MVTAVPSPWNSANLVTMARILLVPFFAWALLVDGGESVTWRLVATGIFVVAATSDRLDGYLARRYDLVTDLGKLLDPIADKLLVGTALVLLAWPLGELPWWVPVVVLARELGVTLLRFAVLKYAVMPASRGGKLKTVLQTVAITLFLLPLAHLPVWVAVVAWVVLAAAILVTVVTGLEYAYQGWRLRRDAIRAARLVEPGAGADGASAS
ncbi:CDP-diacylglycerol--glycerol-3-phosphate 3-phosphatidyltransferase [Cellulosimicrobium sp. BIT-GX5]|uniref:CDP-diacylglycerol--glycerol-3-phosphate 3-phosphatidyltransferase n=1 Tax=Cellulosimicrobium composti TaxID=2672572 RepID=A0A6N7ZMD8_9MICO|nr:MULTISPECIES: CDP-diacylglycerol--glycerol-3-phosphate 3-phosphatidyltransferase [Cellulosimicrobium]MTG90597.1 CDP-diacylglycerol--glycerol-3-phosphate 3-phosphatidyltransferase [Cellulosimicrobium composti]NDO90763.1 CDP-diacylglycerol--glycerol-3-phosphate 3-phosphatidyltransferase [Cellulosimicrobium composti]TWG82376.1 CDP-diacylglycerol--glycerol-3-phosphate 3-phosphatidyltransferase [Cellulosimicrobium cellulans J34]SMF33159.1 CDP-diacylglycerol--glycerol-3-phosphate 3-phosphatidyltra